jgi:hypothetical protein
LRARRGPRRSGRGPGVTKATRHDRQVTTAPCQRTDRRTGTSRRGSWSKRDLQAWSSHSTVRSWRPGPLMERRDVLSPSSRAGATWRIRGSIRPMFPTPSVFPPGNPRVET